jgi:hypothetical protein
VETDKLAEVGIFDCGKRFFLLTECTPRTGSSIQKSGRWGRKFHRKYPAVELFDREKLFKFIPFIRVKLEIAPSWFFRCRPLHVFLLKVSRRRNCRRLISESRHASMISRAFFEFREIIGVPAIVADSLGQI